MNIYSNTFFQRVDNHTIIEKIIEEGFKAFYCKEEIYRGKKIAPTYIGIPMVSFCDLPLAHISKNNYGKCGIGMSRKWGVKHHLEPVLYYPNDVSCQSTKMIIKAADDFINNRNAAEAYRILGYAKPISKPTPSKGKSSNNYVEREWRKVYANPAPLKWLSEDEYIAYRGVPGSDKTAVGTPLHFSVNDIVFILVDKPNLNHLLNHIMNVLSHIGGGTKPITNDERLILLSKILVYEDLVHNL